MWTTERTAIFISVLLFTVFLIYLLIIRLKSQSSAGMTASIIVIILTISSLFLWQYLKTKKCSVPITSTVESMQPAQEENMDSLTVVYANIKYEISGKSYNSRIQYAVGADIKLNKRDVLKKGDILKIKYNPKNPSEAILDYDYYNKLLKEKK